MRGLENARIRCVRRALILALLLLGTACDSSINQLTVEADIPRHWHWSDHPGNYELLATLALESSANDLRDQLPSDIHSYCVTYHELSADLRLRFWGDLLAAMSYHESGHDTELTYQEDFTDNNGDRVVSRGLLQLSLESSQGYDCPLIDASELHDPAKNIDCAVRILHKWIEQDGVISQDAGWLAGGWKGAARYWGVFRRPAVRETMQAQMQGRAYCQIQAASGGADR